MSAVCRPRRERVKIHSNGKRCEVGDGKLRAGGIDVKAYERAGLVAQPAQRPIGLALSVKDDRRPGPSERVARRPRRTRGMFWRTPATSW